jgi:hypothetical protein
VAEHGDLAPLGKVRFDQEQTNGPEYSRLVEDASFASQYFTDDELEACAMRRREQAIDTLPEVADDGEEDE